MGAFKPLDFIRTVTTDEHLTSSTEVAILVALAMGTDNQTHKVRRSLSDIARAAKCDRNWLSEVLERPQVARYLANVERKPRRVDIWLRQDPLDMRSESASEVTDMRSESASNMRSESASEQIPETPHAESVRITCGVSPQGLRSQSAPSALSTPSALTGDAPAEEMEGDEDTDAWLDQQADDAKPGLHHFAVASPRRESRLPEWKQQDLYERQMREEGLNEYGEPLGLEY